MKRLEDPGSGIPPRGFVAGAPRWLTEMTNHCARCGAELTLGPLAGEHRRRHHCESCGFVAYLNPRLVVTTLPITDSGELVLLRRAIEPGKGAWAQPGGFLEADETAMAGAVRETEEETGLRVEPIRIVGLYSRIQAAVVVVAYEARIVGGRMTPTDEALEVRPFQPHDLPWSRLAFNTTAWALRDWIGASHPEIDLGGLGIGDPEG